MEQKKENVVTIPAAIIIAGLIVAGAIMYNKPAMLVKSGLEAKPNAITINPITPGDHMKGAPDATVTIVEFSDLECPFCKVFHTTMQKIMSEYGTSGKVAWVYRHFPLSKHPKARNEAAATECAFTQGGNDAFWKFADGVFAITPSNNGLNLEVLPQIAKNIGLDVNAFTKCLSTNTFDERINKDYNDGIKVGIGSIPESGTPYSVIVDKKGNKVPINGAQPYEVLKEVIDGMLADNS